MKGLIALCALAIAAGSATDAHAQMYKCVKNGRATYQESPCAAGEAESSISTGRPSAWAGCYEVAFQQWGGGGTEPPQGLEIRRGSGGLVMQFRDKERTTFELRQVTDAELKNMQASMKGSGSTVHDGMGIRSQLDADPEAAKRAQPPGGIYKAKDEQGKEVMFIIMPFTVGLTKKVPC